MARFYLHLCNGDGWTRDPDGLEFPDPADAIAAALKDARELIAADVTEGRPVFMSSFITVEDAEGQEVHRITYTDAARFVEGPLPNG
ncbi:MAG TPA: hypothetical protein VGD66_10135 [Allosphingosinicella sp.]